MNTTASFHAETSWSRRCSTETVFSVQGRETDFVQDSSDTELGSGDDHGVQYEPATDTEEGAPLSDGSSGETESELSPKQVVIVTVGDDGDLQLADSEAGSNVSDSELDLPAYWTCARCHNTNDNATYRYCLKCFKTRKSFFPPRPRRKEKREPCSQEGSHLTSSQDSGIDSLNSQEFKNSQDLEQGTSQNSSRLGKGIKRRASSAERPIKRALFENTEEESDGPVEVAPLVKTISDPSVTIESLDTCKDDNKDLCIICFTEPKTGVFVHRRVAHICCCYKCAVKVWLKAKRCPVCNCKVSNVLKAVVM